MRVFMLGWEFPPYISGGLGTACYGLTSGLSRSDVGVIFVLPMPIDCDKPSHIKLLGVPSNGKPDRVDEHAWPSEIDPQLHGQTFANVTFRTVSARFHSPYQSSGGRLWQHEADTAPTTGSAAPTTGSAAPALAILQGADQAGWSSAGYQGDLIAESHRYAVQCVDLARREQFDVIHAHDWLTFPAGMAVAAVFGKPLVVHVHSTEFDRAGEHVQQQVYDIERRGMHAAIRVVAVSHMTAAIIQHRYTIKREKIVVIYNGIDNGTLYGNHEPTHTGIRRGDKIVLFLGRITMQKGPEYFIMAAKKVLEKVSNVKFVMAGTGDKIRDVIELAARENIGHKVLFTGFLRGKDVNRVYRMANVYVMPSVSEPFGIAPLEAIRHDVPVIISKTSGVSEVLTHALKVNFWDIEDIANKIVAVLKHPPLSTTLREHADIEVRRLTWDGAATKCRSVYDEVVQIVGP